MSTNPTYETVLLSTPTHTPNVRTDYATAARGFDPAFRDALIAKITTAIAHASMVKDAPILAIRTGETVEALITCLIATAAMSPQFDQPSFLREFANDLAKRIRRGVAKARANPSPDMERFFGVRKEGSA